MLTAQRQEHLQTEYWVAWYRGLSFRRSSRSRGMSNNKNCTAFWAGEGDFIYPTLNPTVGPKGCYWKKCVARHAERLVLYVKIWDHPPKRFWDQTPTKIREELSALQERRSRHQLSWQVGQRSICWRYTKIQLYWGVFGEFLFKGDRSLCVNLAYLTWICLFLSNRNGMNTSKSLSAARKFLQRSRIIYRTNPYFYQG